MISAEFCRTMARYNAWQNAGLRKLVAGMSDEELDFDRGAFFGSIRATLNHLLWADTLWMSRFTDLVAAPTGSISESVRHTLTKGDWDASRYRLDGVIREWADGLKDIDLTGELRWHSALLGREVSKRRGFCITHFFNHQTHHRGQVHAMMTAAGLRPGDTDLFLLPDIT